MEKDTGSCPKSEKDICSCLFIWTRTYI